MALKIRLARAGSKKRPYYHVVIADVRSPRDGRFIEQVGSWNPILPKDGEAKRVVLNEERIKHWLEVGAQPTDRVMRFLDEAGLAHVPLAVEYADDLGLPLAFVTGGLVPRDSRTENLVEDPTRDDVYDGGDGVFVLPDGDDDRADLAQAVEVDEALDTIEPGHLHQVVEALVHGVAVHVDDLVALLAEQFVDLVLQVGDGGVAGFFEIDTLVDVLVSFQAELVAR